MLLLIYYQQTSYVVKELISKNKGIGDSSSSSSSSGVDWPSPDVEIDRHWEHSAFARPFRRNLDTGDGSAP